MILHVCTFVLPGQVSGRLFEPPKQRQRCHFMWHTKADTPSPGAYTAEPCRDSTRTVCKILPLPRCALHAGPLSLSTNDHHPGIINYLIYHQDQLSCTFILGQQKGWNHHLPLPASRALNSHSRFARHLPTMPGECCLNLANVALHRHLQHSGRLNAQQDTTGSGGGLLHVFSHCLISLFVRISRIAPSFVTWDDALYFTNFGAVWMFCRYEESQWQAKLTVQYTCNRFSSGLGFSAWPRVLQRTLF